MPAYEYSCPTCKAVVTIVKKLTDDSTPKCETCKIDLKKNFNVGAVYIR